MKQNLPITVIGHVKIQDDLGCVLLDEDNAVHPQNMSRIIARALANESNYWVHRIAFGNGGTVVDAAYQITYKTPNDGQAPDPAEWRSRLYNETYSEIVDDSNVGIGTGLGSVPAGDPTSTEHVSGPGVRSSELGLTSEVVIEVTLNPGEPTGQTATDGPTNTNTESDFTFDEIGIFTTGGPAVALPGYQHVSVGDKRGWDDTGLAPSTPYTFTIVVDGGAPQPVSVTTPAIGSGTVGEILYSDLISLINVVVTTATASITDGISQTYGFLKFSSNSVGVTSTIALTDGTLFAALTGFVGIDPAVPGVSAGIDNDPVNPSTERERMLTHIIFSPVLKSANRTLTVTYTLTVAVARSV